jgi:hypothetical protein
MLEFEAAAADVLEVRTEEAYGGRGRDGRAGLVDSLLVNEDSTGEDQSLGALARGGVTAIDEEFVEADLFRTDFFVTIFRRGHHFRVHAIVPESIEADRYLFMVYERGDLC